MSAKSTAGYALLFIFLFFLILVHPGFVLLFLLAIIIVVTYKIKQRIKSKPDSSRSYSSKNPQKNSFADSVSDTDPENLSEDNENIIKKDKPDTSPFESLSQESPSTGEDSPISKKPKTGIDATGSPKTQKKSFDANYWNFNPHDTLQSKKLKFLKAIDVCEENNLESKSRMRRLRMKIDRWDVENERDIEAMIPDYESLLDLIEEFENR